MKPPCSKVRHLNRSSSLLLFGLLSLPSQVFANDQHHMRQKPPELLELRQVLTAPLRIVNQCSETLWPGILTQHGDGPPTSGFELSAGSRRDLIVSENWQGRVWGRTNCSFNGGGQSSKRCGTGDCGTSISCIGTGEIPTTLAEFTLDAGDGHTYYDISLVDGYNLPMAIVMLPQSNRSFQEIPKRLTNPSCVASVGEAVAPDFNAYADGEFLGTTAQDPLEFERDESLSDIAQWCPWNLQVSTLDGPNGGVYIYPDGQLNRPAFDPCLSACARYNKPQDCCTGAYSSPSTCSPSSYSRSAKSVCPDAYSYAFDDQTSTFIIPSGAGFEVIFCPGGRSTDIISTSKNELVELAQRSRTANKVKRQSISQKWHISEIHHNDSFLIPIVSSILNEAAADRTTRQSCLALWILLVWGLLTGLLDLPTSG